MIDMKYKVYCISAMMLCCVVSKAQEKDTVEVGDSVKKRKCQPCMEEREDTYHTWEGVERDGQEAQRRSHGQYTWHQRLQYVDGRRRDF